jgi:hypothetical protein
MPVCQAGTSLTQPQSNLTVPPMFGSKTWWSLAEVLGQLVGHLDDRHDRRAGALGDVDRVAEVVGVAVGEQDDVGLDLVGADRRLRVARQERGRSGRACRRPRAGTPSGRAR